MVSHWAVVGLGNGRVGSFQSKKNDWGTDQYRPRNSWERVEMAHLRDVGDDVLAKSSSGGVSGGGEQRNEGEEGKRRHWDT